MKPSVVVIVFMLQVADAVFAVADQSQPSYAQRKTN
eukprot:CAMPEP_0203913988 /NCGR_PEP_ID=MMETSP0359-20131031/54938_1 /ASSEMBLY_ACC=CAM_ASM_000338 /TAXON_ID=268821 /ORGANISM="Scrippsiella Hangoei, Strain SHTV-5" /LENGTH=35 /DNA_ID= /DNA_START= /DNA_END= /DNA_ORIENTATION=